MAAIEILDFAFSYPGFAESEPYQALRDINLRIEEGSFVILAGMTGSGKSTLLTNLKPELAPLGLRSGIVRIYGEQVSYEESQIGATSIRVGYVLQDPASQIVTDTVWHELAFGLENLGTTPEEMHRRIAETASFFGITSWFEMRTSELSGGQKQLLNLAAIMVMQPRLLLLDEPTSQLDPLATKEFINALYRVNQELGITVVIITHDLEEVAPLTDQVIFIADRTVSFSGSFQSFIEKCINDYHNYLPALPSATQLAHLVDPSCRPLPLTVRDGREWLIKRLVATSETAINGTHNGEKTGSSATPIETPTASPAVPAKPAVPAVPTKPAVPAVPAKPAIPTKPAMSNRQVLLSARHLWFAYARQSPLVLRELSLDLYAGRISGIVGSNASGKSTLMAILAGIRKPQRGKLKRAAGLVSAVLPQDPKALFTQNNLLDELSDDGRGGSYQREEVDYWVKRLALTGLEDRHPYDLSGGEQQKAALAKLLLVKPQLLLLDEPTKGLDAFTKAELLFILRDLANEGHAIVIVSHDLDFVANVSDECSMLFNGSLVGTGPVHDFFAGNLFYTTVIYRITRESLPGCIRLGDVYPYVS
ncbi:MAG: ATP-binding cassette domain-containing protein [Coriobacteriales bacterium]|jgi:energy-coupling factor transport system ATP-binding protein|nr:ATP-binding cassette domain-containing protein [Coriobacteriales bacterium]